MLKPRILYNEFTPTVDEVSRHEEQLLALRTQCSQIRHFRHQKCCCRVKNKFKECSSQEERDVAYQHINAPFPVKEGWRRWACTAWRRHSEARRSDCGGALSAPPGTSRTTPESLWSPAPTHPPSGHPYWTADAEAGAKFGEADRYYPCIRKTAKNSAPDSMRRG